MNQLLTTEAVAPIFKVTPATIRLWALRGLIQGSKIGKKWYFEENAINDLLKIGRNS